ncbi:DMT family transporter [Vibrio tritonius]|uniref:DMT family transporter n=1 Tax=Vibrio tritonius TaxID=1435069 RepID=UPI00315D8562
MGKNQNTVGALLVLIATFTLTIKDSADKYLMLHHYHPVQILWFRFAIPALIMAVFMRKEFVISIKVTQWRLLARSAMFLFCALVSVIVLKDIPLNTYIMIAQLGPIAYMLAGILFFKEKFSGLRWGATLLGFLGVMVILQPSGTAEFNWMYVLPLLIVFAATSYNLITKTISKDVSSLSIFINTFWVLGCVSSLLLLTSPGWWVTPQWQNVPYLAVVPIVTLVSQFCLIRAMKLAEASYLAPFFYFQIVFACLLGYWWFDEVPTHESLLGGVLIVLAGALLMLRRAPAKSTATEQI